MGREPRKMAKSVPVLCKNTTEWSCGSPEVFRGNVVPLSSMDVRRHKHVSIGQIYEGYNREELVYYS